MPNMAPPGADRVRRSRRGTATPSAALEIVRSYLAAPVDAEARSQASIQADLAAFARHLYEERRMRDKAFPVNLFSDPIWDMLLVLYACAVEGKQLSVSEACQTSRAPPSSALRYIKEMTEQGLVVRDDCTSDARRVYVRLSDKGRVKMSDLLTRTMRDRLMFGLAGR